MGRTEFDLFGIAHVKVDLILDLKSAPLQNEFPRDISKKSTYKIQYYVMYLCIWIDHFSLLLLWPE